MASLDLSKYATLFTYDLIANTVEFRPGAYIEFANKFWYPADPPLTYTKYGETLPAMTPTENYDAENKDIAKSQATILKQDLLSLKENLTCIRLINDFSFYTEVTLLPIQEGVYYDITDIKKGNFGTGPGGTTIYDGKGHTNAQFLIYSDTPTDAEPDYPDTIFISPDTVDMINGSMFQNVYFLLNCNTIPTSFVQGTFLNPVHILNTDKEGSIYSTYLGRYYGDDFTIEDYQGAEAQYYNIGNTIGAPPPRPPCFVEGTELMTLGGKKKVQDLNIGDKVAVYGDISENEAKPHEKNCWSDVKWIGRKTFTVTPETAPVCFPKDVFGPNAPYKPLFVSPGHLMITKEGKGVRAEGYVGWGDVKKDHTQSTVTYYHVELEKHSVVIADGVLTESYLDVGNRGEFKEFKK